MNALRTVIPELPRSVGELAVAPGPHHAPALDAHRRSSRACSRAAAFRTRSTAGPSTTSTCASCCRSGSIREHTEIWWTVRPHQSFGTVEMRACDGLPDLDQSLAVCALQVALDGDVRAPLRRGRAAAEPAAPRAGGELLARAALGQLAGADRPRAPRRGARRRARARRCSRRPTRRCGRSAWRRSCAPLDTLLEEDNATRLIRLVEEGADMGELFAERGARARATPSGARCGERARGPTRERARRGRALRAARQRPGGAARRGGRELAGDGRVRAHGARARGAGRARPRAGARRHRRRRRAPPLARGHASRRLRCTS